MAHRMDASCAIRLVPRDQLNLDVLLLPGECHPGVLLVERHQLSAALICERGCRCEREQNANGQEESRPTRGLSDHYGGPIWMQRTTKLRIATPRNRSCSRFWV